MAQHANQTAASLQLDCGGAVLDLSFPQVMGVLNVTPDSFSDGGSYFTQNRIDLDKALQRAEQMLDEGATIIDVGGESTRPGAKIVTEQQELDRVIPVVEAINSRLSAIISVDTSNAAVMQESASAGAGIINDVRALTRDGAMQAAVNTGLPVCLMHMQQQPGNMQNAPSYHDVTQEIYEYLAERIKACVAAGIGCEKILIDPGIGFGKTLQHNLKLMNNLDVFGELGVPLLLGVSRKSMIGKILDKPAGERLYGGLAAATLGIAKGARIIRCHDVAATVDAVKVAQAIIGESFCQE